MTISKTVQWEAAAAAVENANSILIVTHVNPDGDAIGSLLGLGRALHECGKVVVYAVDEGGLDYLQFLPGAEDIQPKLASGEWDLMISVDASDQERSGLVGAYGREHSKTVINLDHHATNTMFGDIQLVDPSAVSATQVITEWLDTMSVTITQAVATALLTGLVTDTLGFRTSNVTSSTLDTAHRLMQAGASLTEITERTLDNRSFKEVTLWKHALNSVQLHQGGVIIAEITQDDLKKSGISDVSDAGLVGFLVKVNEAMIAAVFKEAEDNTVRLSLRSKPGFDVAEVAFGLGGGGHKQASGATIEGSLEDAKKRVLPLLKEAARIGKLTIA